MKGTAFAAAALAMVATGVAAEESDIAPIEVAGSILAVTKALEEQGLVEWVGYADFDGDLDPEAFVVTTITPSDTDSDLREWRVIDDIDGMGAQVGTWYGTDIELIETPPARRGDPSLSIVRSDGSYWYLFKNKMRPYGDLVSARTRFIHKGLKGDENLFSDFGLVDVPARYMARLTLDLTDAQGDEVLTSLFGDGFWRESDGATPYVLTTATGELIYSGWSFTHPSIFALPYGGFQIIEAVDGGYRAVFFPEGDTQ